VRELPPRWTVRDEIAALTLERADLWWSTSLSAKEGEKLPPTITITHPDRPKPEPERKKTKSVTELAQMFGGG
jgi:hypothetical protein